MGEVSKVQRPDWRQTQEISDKKSIELHRKEKFDMVFYEMRQN